MEKKIMESLYFSGTNAGVMIYLQEEKIYNSISKSYLFI